MGTAGRELRAGSCGRGAAGRGAAGRGAALGLGTQHRAAPAGSSQLRTEHHMVRRSRGPLKSDRPDLGLRSRAGARRAVPVRVARSAAKPGLQKLHVSFSAPKPASEPRRRGRSREEGDNGRARSIRYRARSSRRSVLSPGPGSAGGVEPAMLKSPPGSGGLPKTSAGAGLSPRSSTVGAGAAPLAEHWGGLGKRRGLIPVPNKVCEGMVSPCWDWFRCWLRLWEKSGVK